MAASASLGVGAMMAFCRNAGWRRCASRFGGAGEWRLWVFLVCWGAAGVPLLLGWVQCCGLGAFRVGVLVVR